MLPLLALKCLSLSSQMEREPINSYVGPVCGAALKDQSMTNKENRVGGEEEFPLDAYIAVYNWITKWAEETYDPEQRVIAQAAYESLTAVGVLCGTSCGKWPTKSKYCPRQRKRSIEHGSRGVDHLRHFPALLSLFREPPRPRSLNFKTA
jgi:hypothetical protein